VSEWASIVGPVLAAIIVVVGGAWTYKRQKEIDRKTALIETRRKSYQRYLAAFSMMTNTPDAVEKITRELRLSEFDLLVLGSDKVIKRVNECRKFYVDTNDDRFKRDKEKIDELVGEICLAMREDCFEESSLLIEEFQNLVGFK